MKITKTRIEKILSQNNKSVIGVALLPGYGEVISRKTRLERRKKYATKKELVKDILLDIEAGSMTTK